MNGEYFREKVFRGKENKKSMRICNYGIYVDLYDRLEYGLDRSFIQDRPPHRLWPMRPGKVRNPHSHKNKK